MGFMDIIGDCMGKAAARMNEIQQYAREYEVMTDDELKKEYNDLRGRSGTEERNRLAAVVYVLKNRGYGN